MPVNPTFACKQVEVSLRLLAFGLKLMFLKLTFSQGARGLQFKLTANGDAAVPFIS